MAKRTRGRRSISSRQCRPTPYPSAPYTETESVKNCSKIFKKKDWEDATCSVCMECPHNAVLLLCSSHEKGCHPYMCGTSFRHSNCLDQYKKAYAKADNFEITELSCPLCRGQVKGWTVVEPAREHLNAKTRSCVHDDCSFLGNYKDLRKHVKTEHPSSKPREVDPVLEQKWRRLERERENEEVIGTIRSSMPGAVFFGDYVIEGGNNRFGVVNSDDEDGFNAETVRRWNEDHGLLSVFLFLQAFGSDGNNVNRGGMRPIDDDDEDDDRGDVISLNARLRRQGRVLLSRSRRRRMHRQANGDR